MYNVLLKQNGGILKMVTQLLLDLTLKLDHQVH